ncbi:MAG TPA: hypothetical protein ENF99_00910, partial [Candidatus Aenigmarchaeota archaeon]|nr:hypothetical protein [Candidatus Aenigmarchaeota archaeon]
MKEFLLILFLLLILFNPITIDEFKLYQNPNQLYRDIEFYFGSKCSVFGINPYRSQCLEWGAFGFNVTQLLGEAVENLTQGKFVSTIELYAEDYDPQYSSRYFGLMKNYNPSNSWKSCSAVIGGVLPDRNVIICDRDMSYPGFCDTSFMYRCLNSQAKKRTITTDWISKEDLLNIRNVGPYAYVGVTEGDNYFKYGFNYDLKFIARVEVECLSDASCPSDRPICDTSGIVWKCVECLTNEDCEYGELCVNKTCLYVAPQIEIKTYNESMEETDYFKVGDIAIIRAFINDSNYQSPLEKVTLRVRFGDTINYYNMTQILNQSIDLNSFYIYEYNLSLTKEGTYELRVIAEDTLFRTE